MCDRIAEILQDALPLETFPLLLLEDSSGTVYLCPPTVLTSTHAGKPACRFASLPWAQRDKGDFPGVDAVRLAQWPLPSEGAVQVLESSQFGCAVLDSLSRGNEAPRTVQPRPAGYLQVVPHGDPNPYTQRWVHLLLMCYFWILCCVVVSAVGD